MEAMARLNEEFKLMDFWNTGQARAKPLLLAVKAVTLARKSLLGCMWCLPVLLCWHARDASFTLCQYAGYT